MSRWIKFTAATVLGVAVVGCGANGGDPVARQQAPSRSAARSATPPPSWAGSA